MRRKSARNAQKASPEKAVKETETPPKTRRSRRRKRSPSKSSESEDEVLTITKRAPIEATPDTTTKSHTPSDEETCDEPVWKVTSSEDTPKGEIQKLKICLTRPSPDSPDKSKTRRSKSNSQTEDDATSSEDKSSTRRTRSRGSPLVRNDGLSSQDGDEEVEEKKGKGKSKGKHKSKIEKSPHLSEPEIQPNNEISENVQVTPQSPSIDKRVDNENDSKVDVDDKNINESVQRQENVNDVDKEQVGNKTVAESQNDESDDEPLSIIKKNVSVDKLVNENTHLSPEPEKTNETPTQNEPSEYQDSDHVTNKHEVQTVIDEKQEDDQVEEQIPEVETEKIEVEEKTSESVITDEEPLKETEVEKVEDISATLNETQDVEMASLEEKSEETNAISEDTTETEEPQASKSIVEQENIELNQETSPQKTPEVPVESTQVSKESAHIEKSQRDNVESTQVSQESTHIEKSQPDNEDRHRSPRRRLQRSNDYLKSDSKEQEESIKSGPIRPFKTKRTWEGSLNSTSSLLKVDLDSIQVVCPTIEFPEEPDLNLEVEKERRRSVTESSGKKLERKVSVEYKSDTSERPSFEKQNSVNSSTQDGEDNSNIIAFNRKISIVDDTASKLKPPPSPAKNPVSNILYITNLVRPFTVKQLKELLERTGKVQEDGFWTDRIKSKCYVQYETQEEAEATRNALHGVQWPIGNGKKLIIDFATAEDMENAKNPPAPPPVAVPDTKVSTKENLEPVESKQEKAPKEVEKKKPEGPVREWDIGKRDVRRDRSRSRERGRKHRRSPSPSDDFITRKQRKAEDSVPQKLMDDLFLKTKATPSIYWQPLSPEEISMKQQQRLIRMEEHKRRMEENSRMKGREMGRGAFRRRYD
ncbi:apoptotic chromatin condensation inducer in the nucleus [Tribolium madens]|uniref:apoptotic chromatin condensation inducer in the nucleus n=1 Tax=Tribolium madens TaxID=41895 RepID=UPI001CF72376|nr:apoptotic chromatin condensation inducer in the nucleus [Tribolium madens]